MIEVLRGDTGSLDYNILAVLDVRIGLRTCVGFMLGTIRACGIISRRKGSRN